MTVNILMPALSPTMTEGTLAKWLVKVGDQVQSGDVLAEIETDKATMEVEAVEEGTIGKILVPDGSEKVAVNSVIAVLLEEGESADDIKDVEAPTPAPATPSPAPAEEKPAPEAPTPSPNPTPSPAPQKQGERIFITPLAKRMASDNNLDIAALQGSGPHGRIIKADVEAALKTGGATLSATAPAPAGDKMAAELVPLNNMRKVIAQRLTESKQNVPHFYLTRTCELDNLLAARKEINDSADGEYKLSVNDFIIKAIAAALQKTPAANAEWTGDAIKLYRHANISVAVAIDGGLITPVIWQAESKGLVQISQEMQELAALAKDGKLTPEQYQGGSFSLSNLGMFGIDSFSAVINPPQACILAVGGGVQKPVVRDGQVAIRTMMTVTLSVDHRAVDGAIGAEFLKAFVAIIENPIKLIL